MNPSILFTLTILATIHTSSADQPFYKLCLSQNYDANLCRGIEAGNSQVSCVQALDSAECTLRLKNGSVDFGLFHPEQSVLAAKLANDFVKIIGEVRYNKMLDVRHRFKAVVVVPADFSGSFEDLKNKNFCHPGFEMHHSFTDRVLKSFEHTVVPMPCFKVVSSTEQEVAQIDSFFKSACRPGPWAQDHYLNTRLKKSYPDLCKICDFPDDCQHNTKTVGAFEAVLNCLTKNGGDVAYTSARKVQEYFGLIPGFAPQANSSNYKLLCPDKKVQDINSTSPCTWFRQPWPLLLARKDVAGELQPKLLNWLNPDSQIKTSDLWIQPLRKLLVPYDFSALNTSLPQSLDNYLDRGVDDDLKTCRPSVKWCTTSSEEQVKCNVLKHAASTHGMTPSIECIPSQSMWNCMGHMANEDVDIMSLDTEYGYIARKVYNLTTVVYEDASRDTYYKIIAVLKEDESKIKSAKDLRFKKACFPEYRGLGWVSFVSMLRNLAILKKKECPEDFLGDSCAPGATDSHHSINTDKKIRLCQLCPAKNGSRDTCAIESDPADPTKSSSFFGDLGAMSCLASSGDIAVVDYMRLLTGQKGELDGNIDPKGFRVLCRNGSLAQSAGLDVDNDCALSMGIKGEVVSRKNRPGVESRDTSELLLNLDKWFGALGQSNEGVLRMYGKFHSHNDGLFVDGTVSLVHKDDTSYPLVQGFSSLMASSNDECPSSSSVFLPSCLISITAFLFIFN